MGRVKATCIAAVVSDGTRNHAVLVHHTGGTVAGYEYNIWHGEIDNSIYIDDIFTGYEEPPSSPGFYVWEGELEPVHDDQPGFYGKWRPATKADLSALADEPISYKAVEWVETFSDGGEHCIKCQHSNPDGPGNIHECTVDSPWNCPALPEQIIDYDLSTLETHLEQQMKVVEKLQQDHIRLTGRRFVPPIRL